MGHEVLGVSSKSLSFLYLFSTVLSKDCCFSLHGEQGYFFLLFSLCWSPPALTHCPSSSIITPYLCPTSTTPIKFDQLTEDCSGDFTHAFSSAFTRRFRLLLGQCTSGLHYSIYCIYPQII